MPCQSSSSSGADVGSGDEVPGAEDLDPDGEVEIGADVGTDGVPVSGGRGGVTVGERREGA